MKTVLILSGLIIGAFVVGLALIVKSVISEIDTFYFNSDSDDGEGIYWFFSIFFLKKVASLNNCLYIVV